ncbi:MAG: SAM-dependent methyltransferase [Bacteroidota bacterium]
MAIIVTPIATVRNSRTTPTDDFWEEIVSEIVLNDDIPAEAFDQIGNFSHLEIIYHFDRLNPGDVVYSGKPRGNPAYPASGIFSQRRKDRPNAIGLCTVELLEHSGRTIKVRYLDAIDGTPVLDIKPVFREFQPKGEIKQPGWVADLMKNYWK